MSPRWGSHDLVRLRLGAHAFNSGLSPRAIRCRPVGAPMIWFGSATGLMPSTRGSRPELYDVAPLGLPMIWFGSASGLMPSTRGSRPELYDVAPLGLP